MADDDDVDVSLLFTAGDRLVSKCYAQAFSRNDGLGRDGFQ